MDIYYSLWTNGWRTVNLNLDMWRFSFGLVKKNYPDSKVYLVTDTKGAKILKSLPFDKVFIILDELNDFKKAWSLGKILAYKKAAENGKPFLHLDADVFLWEKLPEKLTNANIFAQSFDVKRKFRDKGLKSAYDIEHIIEKFGIVPKEWKDNMDSDMDMINMGIFGGTDLKLIKEYCDYCLNMVFDKKFYDLWAEKGRGKLIMTCLPCMLEQMNLAFFLKEKKIKINLLFNYFKDAKNNPYKYTHLMDLKNDKNILKRIEERLMTKNFAPNIINLITVVTLGINV